MRLGKCVCACNVFISSPLITCFVASNHNDIPNPHAHPLTKTLNEEEAAKHYCAYVHWAVQTTASFFLSEVWLRGLQDSHMACIRELLHSVWNAAAGHDDQHPKTCQHGGLTFDKAVTAFTHKSLGKKLTTRLMFPFLENSYRAQFGILQTLHGVHCLN